MPWYRSGSVAITTGQTTVSGTGTAFSANSRVGDAFQGPDGRWYEVTNIVSGTVLSILPAYQGATVSGGAYGLAPMQGYVKESADRLRQMVEQFGATLALLGTPSSAAKLRENIGAASRGANSDITSLTGMTTALSVAQGGTGGASQDLARAGLGLKNAAVADIVGTVSQAVGLPTGAIMERGSNSIGEYARYADGTQVCWNSSAAAGNLTTTTTTGGGFQGSNVSTINFPVAFSSAPTVAVAGRFISGNRAWLSLSFVSSTFFSCIAHSFSNNAVIQVDYIAIGRWY